MMTSSPTLDPFPLYDLNKVCFLAVAELLDNKGRRRLSQTCQRFRHLLIPEDRYTNPPESYWEEISGGNPFSFAQHHRNVPNGLETRRVCDLLNVERAGNSFGIHVYFSEPGRRTISVHETADGEPSTGVYLRDGRIREDRYGRLPAVINETLYELAKYLVFERGLHLSIVREPTIRLRLVLSSSCMFQSTPIRVVYFLPPISETTANDDAILLLMNDFRIGKSIRPELEFRIVNLEPIGALRKLKALMTQQNHGDIEWKEASNTLYLLKLSKENGRLVGHIDDKYANELG